MLIDKLLHVNTNLVIIFYTHRSPVTIQTTNHNALELAYLTLGITDDILDVTAVTFPTHLPVAA